MRFTSEEHIQFELRYPNGKARKGDSQGILLLVLGEEDAGKTPDWLKELDAKDKTIVLCEPRGIGSTRWTRKNGPNYVERSHALLGRTVDTGRVWDIIAAAKYLSQSAEGKDSPTTIHVAGKGPSGILAAYAAVLDESIGSVTLLAPPKSHMDKDAPQFLSILRICDIPDTLALIAPRPLTLTTPRKDTFRATASAYEAAGASDSFQIRLPK